VTTETNTRVVLEIYMPLSNAVFSWKWHNFTAL